MNEATRNRVLWHSRRGMLELDLLLEPFARHRYERLTDSQQIGFQRLLACEDQDLFTWLMQRGEPDDVELREIIGLILDNASRSG